MIPNGVKLALLVKAASRGDVNLAADYGLYPCLFGSLVEINCTVHNAVVGYGNGCLPQLGRTPDKVVYTARAV